MATFAMPISDFYHSCRNNDIKSVKSLLQTMTPAQIDQLEPNGSTALHAACYYGHDEIVKLLLEKGASRSIKNKYNLTPFEEGNTDAIRELFSRENARDRFVGDANDSIDWIRIGELVNQEAKVIRKVLKNYAKQQQKKKAEIQIEMIDFGDYKDIHKIQQYFEQANAEDDPIYLIKAYTEETDFYRRLNQALATVYQLDPTDESQRQLLDFLHLICYHPRFEDYHFKGQTYRGMQMTEKEFLKYQVGEKFMTKSLTSTSKDRNTAERFATKNGTDPNGDSKKRSCLFKYQIRKAHTSLSIEQISTYPGEQEVLLTPFSVFEVISIEQIETDDGSLTEIELRQCKSLIKTYSAMAALGGTLLAATVGTIIGLFAEEEWGNDSD